MPQHTASKVETRPYTRLLLLRVVGRGSNDLGRGSDDLGRGSNDLGRGMLKYKLSHLKMPKNAKKAKCDKPTDGPTRWLIGRVSATKI